MQIILKTILKKIPALAYFYEQLKLRSSISYTFILDQEMMNDSKEIEDLFDQIQEAYDIVDKSDVLAKVELALKQLKPIHFTLNYLEQKQDLTDIDCFEIKHFAFINRQLKSILETINFQAVKLPDLTSVIDILDPENTKVSTFWIYDSYHHELSSLRADYKHVEDDKKGGVRFKIETIEKLVLHDLTEQLQFYAKILQKAYRDIAQLDIIIAKAELSRKLHLIRPHISSKIKYKGLFNPQVKQLLEIQHKQYQPVDMELLAAPTLITGANMSGKTLLLKNLMLAQYLLQFGFYVPAEQANMKLFSEIFVLIGDHSSELQGLSSFGTEILSINDLILKIKQGDKPLVLIDEPARTTNPKEGAAIVKALLQYLCNYKIISCITTHYTVNDSKIRRLRVKGLRQNITENISPFEINDLMDYTLIEDKSTTPPQEAVNIASLLKVDSDFLAVVKKELVTV